MLRQNPSDHHGRNQLPHSNPSESLPAINFHPIACDRPGLSRRYNEWLFPGASSRSRRTEPRSCPNSLRPTCPIPHTHHRTSHSPMDFHSRDCYSPIDHRAVRTRHVGWFAFVVAKIQPHQPPIQRLDAKSCAANCRSLVRCRQPVAPQSPNGNDSVSAPARQLRPRKPWEETVRWSAESCPRSCRQRTGEMKRGSRDSRSVQDGEADLIFERGRDSLLILPIPISSPHIYFSQSPLLYLSHSR